MIPEELFLSAIPRGKKSDEYWKRLFAGPEAAVLLRALFSGAMESAHEIGNSIRHHDDRAAVVCALSAAGASVSSGSSLVPRGPAKDGHIVLPPRRLFADWASRAVLSVDAWSPISTCSGASLTIRSG